jgi:hypothetical protein
MAGALEIFEEAASDIIRRSHACQIWELLHCGKQRRWSAEPCVVANAQ